MKKLLLLLFVCNAFDGIAQLAGLSEQRNDTAFDKLVRQIVLADNQFIDAENKDFLVLFTIVPELALMNKDSLLHESKSLYKQVQMALGVKGRNETIDIAYWGRETDRNNVSFSYSHDKYRGEVISYGFRRDTLLAPDDNVRERLFKLEGNKYVRHVSGREGLSIIFKVISKEASSMNQKRAEMDALKFFVLYLREQHCLYQFIKISYIDQYTGEANLFTVKTDNLIVNDLIEYYNNSRRKPPKLP